MSRLNKSYVFEKLLARWVSKCNIVNWDFLEYKMLLLANILTFANIHHT